MQVYSRSEIDAMLTGYRENLARRVHLSEEVKELKRVLDSLTEDSLIDTEVARSQSYENADMPHGGQIGDPTARLGMKFAEGYKPEYYKQLADEYQKKLTGLMRVERAINLVEGWLLILNDKERLVVECRVMEAQTWPDTASRFKGVFGFDVSKSSLKRHKMRGMEKIYRIVEACDAQNVPLV